MRSTALLLGSLALVQAIPTRRVIKRQVEELRDSYDFVVVGGGTSGLTVADRLSEAFPERVLSPIPPLVLPSFPAFLALPQLPVPLTYPKHPNEEEGLTRRKGTPSLSSMVR